jgi:hypothetical protein
MSSSLVHAFPLPITVAVSPTCFAASAAEYSGIAPAAADSTITMVIQANTPGRVFAIGMRCCAKILELSSSNQIDKDQCEKLRKLIMNLETWESSTNFSR